MTESIVVDHVSKRFTMRYHRTLKQMSIAMLRGQDISDSFLAVNDVSFTVQQGESIGLMGLNGSGKSTLLKVINGVMRPDGGKVLTRGRIAGLIASVLLGWRPDAAGVLAGVLGFAIIAVLGLALALLFSVANVYFRDFGKVVQTLTQFTTFSVPMIYPFSMVETRFGDIPGATEVYLLNPVAEAVLLMQRCFWIGTNSDPEAAKAEHLPEDLWTRGLIMLGVSIVILGLSQIWFSKLDKRVPERL